MGKTEETKTTLEETTKKILGKSTHRKSTEDEKGNQTVDTLADLAYDELKGKQVGDRGVIGHDTLSTKNAEVWIQGVRLNGNVGAQILEQNQIERAKREAKTKPRQWGHDT